MNVLMFGWEFPPNNEGGLGTACYGLTKGLTDKGINIILVLPSAENTSAGFRIIGLNNIKVLEVNSTLKPYSTNYEYTLYNNLHNKMDTIYGKNLFQEVERYAQCASVIAKKEKFDVIHAHDWLTYKAGIITKKLSGKPLVVHVHATEFDRTGGNGLNEQVYNIEKDGLEYANKIIAVSNYTKSKIIEHYNIEPKKIEVVHNAIDIVNTLQSHDIINTLPPHKHTKTVLFLGRVTLQKGPDYFLSAARKVLEYDKNVRFIIAGSGDMEPVLIERAAELGIGDKVLFTGRLRGSDVDRAYILADVYVMPSVSEPFGITALEAMSNGTPCIISKQSGVSEVAKHCIKVDFWDIEELANSILGILKYRELGSCMSENAFKDISNLSWDKQAEKCVKVYNEVVHW